MMFHFMNESVSMYAATLAGIAALFNNSKENHKMLL